MLAGTWQSLGELAVVQEVNAGVLISHCQLAAKRLACAHTLHCSSTQDSESKTSTISRTKGAGATAFSCAPQGWGSCRCTGSSDARNEGRQRAKANGRHRHADSRHDERLSRSNLQPGSERILAKHTCKSMAPFMLIVLYALSFHVVVLGHELMYPYGRLGPKEVSKDRVASQRTLVLCISITPNGEYIAVRQEYHRDVTVHKDSSPLALARQMIFRTYIYIYTYTHTDTYIYIYNYI